MTEEQKRGLGTGFDNGFYTRKKWLDTARGFLKEHPYCHECGKPSERAHHIIPVRECLEKGIDLYDTDNLMALCIGCHTKKHIPKGYDKGYRFESGNKANAGFRQFTMADAAAVMGITYGALEARIRRGRYGFTARGNKRNHKWFNANGFFEYCAEHLAEVNLDILMQITQAKGIALPDCLKGVI